MDYIPKHRGEPKVVYRVHFVERERGWSPIEWDSDFDTELEAQLIVRERKALNKLAEAESNGRVPEYYILATYVGPVTL